MNSAGPAPLPDLPTTAAALAEIGRACHRRGWVPATSGNFSARLADGAIAVTRSGRDKARLAPEDILRLDLDGRALDDGKPSAEAGLHLQLYRRDPAIGAVLHTHSLNAALLAEREPDGVEFTGMELLKAFPGIDSHEQALAVPVFANCQDIEALAHEIEVHMGRAGQGHAYLIRGHGLYTWGTRIEDAWRHLEALEYLFEFHRMKGL